MQELKRRHYDQINYYSNQDAVYQNNSISMPEIVVQPKKSLQKMKLIQIKDLSLNQIMKNCYLCVQIFLPSCKGPSLYIVIEDQNKDVIEASVCNLPDSMTFVEGQQYLPLHQWVAIKNPFLKIYKTGVKGLRIEDSQDIVLLSNHSVSVLLKTKPKDCSPLQFKEIGNNYFKTQQYSLAYESYTLALKTDDPSLREICLNNRSLCLIHLGWYEEAISDLKEVLTLNPQNEKANMRMGNALMELQQPITAMEYFKKIENWKLNHELIQKVVNCEMMKKYQNGDFNLYKIFKEYVLNEKVINVFPYKGPIERKKSKIGGLGLFATREIKRGEVLMIEKAMLTVNNNEMERFQMLEQNGQYLDPKQVKFIREMKWKAINNKFVAKKVFELTDGSNCYDIKMQEKEFEYSLEQIDGNADRISEILNRNAHAIHQNQEQFQNEALWHLLSQINHSAFPNCLYYFIGDLQILVSAKNIQKDEEIFISYCSPSSIDKYKKTLQVHKIPLDKEIEYQIKHWQNDIKFEIFHKLEQNPEKVQLLSKINKQLENQFKKEYPFKYVEIYSKVSMTFYKTSRFDQFMEMQIQLVKFDSQEKPQISVIFQLAALIATAHKYGELNEQTNFLFTELSFLLFGPSIQVDDEVKQILIKYSQKVIEK